MNASSPRVLVACRSLRSFAWVVLAALLCSCGGGGGGGDQSSPGAGAPPPPSVPPPTPPPAPPPQPSPVAPTINSEPADATIATGLHATFTVGASGTEPLAYQWRRNGAAIAGATANSYTLEAASLMDSGAEFSVVVTNAAGQAESQSAVVTVLQPPTITTEPEPQHVYVGDRATYSIVAEGSPPLSYQWRRNGVAIPGATGAAYEIAAAEASDSGATFDVIVANAVGFDDSVSVWITVQPPPPSSVAAEPMSFLVALGYASEQSGEQMQPPAGSATVTLDPYTPPLNPYSRERPVPHWYEATWSADGLEHSQFLTPLGGSTRPITLSRRDSGTLAGVDLDRYRGLSTVTYDGGYSARLAMDVLIGPRSGFDEVGVGSWKFIGPEQRGFFAGFPTARSAFIVGEPSPDSAIEGVAAGEYAGFAHGGLEFELLFQNSFWEFSAAASATYDAATHQLTVSLQGFEMHDSSMSQNFPTAWPQAMDADLTILSSVSLACTAIVDPAANAFSCTLADAASGLSGSFDGKFYGRDADELAGTFSIVGLIRASFADGMVGAVALKR